jgi:hypothetical protein
MAPRQWDFFKVPIPLFRRGGPRLSPWAKLVYLVLLSHADATGGGAYPSYLTIGEEAGISERQAMRAVKELERAGLVTVERSRHRSNRYRLAPVGPAQDEGGGVTISHPSDGSNATRVTGGGVTISHPGVTISHPRGDYQSPELDPLNEIPLTRSSRYPPDPPKGGCPEPAEPASGPPPDPEPKEEEDQSPVLLTIPCRGPGPREWALRESQLAEWRKAFPGVDVLAVCRGYIDEFAKHPAYKKTARLLPEHIEIDLTIKQEGVKGKPVWRGSKVRVWGY